MVKSKHSPRRLVLTGLFCSIFCLIASHSKSQAQEIEQKLKDKKAIDKIKLVLNGFTIGTDTKILPYASLDDWFDPYGGLKMEHPAIWNRSDKMFHHIKFETSRDFSWKFRYIANSISTKNTTFSFLFKLKFDRDTYFYGIGNSSVKDERELATYSSLFFGTEVKQNFFDKVVYRWSPGIWDFRSGLVAGGEFEKGSNARYITSRFSLSDINSLDYWNGSMENHWSAYLELCLPTNSSISSYARFNLQTVTRFPVFTDTKLGVGTRIEYLISPERDLVPYFVLPEAGSRSGLRGFSKERFRNFGLVVLNLEYSFVFSKEFEGFLLADLLKTSANLNFLPLKEFHSNFGFGIRFKNNNKPISIGVATSPEGWKLFSTIATGLPW